jgi:hypothetical protein
MGKKSNLKIARSISRKLKEMGATDAIPPPATQELYDQMAELGMLKIIGKNKDGQTLYSLASMKEIAVLLQGKTVIERIGKKVQS